MRKKLLRSRSGFEKPESREEAIMQNILGASNVLEPSESNIEEILKSILYNTPYTKEAEFEIEKILLAIKNNGTYDGECESRDLKILFAILNDLDYTEEAESRIEELFIEWHHQRSSIKVLEGIPPLTFTSLGQPLINYLIEGNTAQSGTPTPDNPIMPQGTGERTGNLFEVSNSNCIIYSTYNQFTITNDSINITGDALFGFIVKCSPNTRYAVSSTRTGYNCDMRIREYSDKPSDWTTDFITQSVNVGSATQSVSFTTNSATKYILVCFYGSNIARISNIMLNLGSEALPYEPYGYKIPILSANTTTPVYLGEVETTRRVKKLVLTGEETYAKQSGTTLYSFNLLSSEKAQARDLIQCSHLPFSWSYSTTISIHIYSSLTTIFLNFGIDVMDSQPSGNTVAGLREYLAAQYAAGTPVTVWYVLATEETAVVNEPLRKIGDYADTLSMEQAGVEIPTVNGSNTLDVDTTLKPSNVYIEYK